MCAMFKEGCRSRRSAVSIRWKCRISESQTFSAIGSLLTTSSSSASPKPNSCEPRLLPGDLLIVEGHGSAAEIGRAAVWDGQIQTCVHQNHLIRARPDRTLLEPAFAAAYLNSSSGRQHLLRRGKTTSGLNTITTSDVKDCTMLVPPIDLQRRFSTIVARTRDTLSRNEVSMQKASDVSASLMSRLLRWQPVASPKQVDVASGTSPTRKNR